MNAIIKINLLEQSNWLLMAIKNRLSARIINDIIVIWCKQLGRMLQEFFAADAQKWEAVCHLNAKMIEKLAQAKEYLVEQISLTEQLSHASIHLLTVLDDNYPKLLKSVLKRTQTPPVLCYSGDLQILDRPTIAIIGSRNSCQTNITFSCEAARYLAEQGVNVISGNARGIDRAAFDGATSTSGCTTVVLPHGIRKLSHVRMQDLLPKIQAGKVLLVSQFHPDAPWVVSRAMDRNKIVTGLAQVVIVAESNTSGGTWDAANSALQQKRPLYVCHAVSSPSLGNNALIERGARPLYWHTEEYSAINDVLYPLLQESEKLLQEQRYRLPLSHQLSLLLKEQGIYPCSSS